MDKISHTKVMTIILKKKVLNCDANVYLFETIACNKVSN